MRTSKFKAILLLALALLALPTFGQGLKAFKLKNGLSVYIWEDNTKSDVFGIVAVRAGSINEPEEYTGLAHYLEHVMFKGTDQIGALDWAKEKPIYDQIIAKYDEMAATNDPAQKAAIGKEINDLTVEAGKLSVSNEFSDLMESIGGKGLNAGTSYDLTYYHNSFPAYQINKWLEISSQRFIHPVFRTFQSELENVYEEYNMYQDNPGSQQSNFLLSSLAGAERIFELLDMEGEPDEGKVVLARSSSGWEWQDGERSVPLCGDVRFSHVGFSYEEGVRILHGISLYAKPGQKIAFVGSTGAGKTTIANLIERFYDIEDGQILFDGIDIRRIAKGSLRRSLGIVLQDTHLFTGTIRENIRYGRLDASDGEVEEAARIASADSFIRRLPNGYDTMVVSDGANLSSGQRQLLAIARAAVADPPVLILDEATSSVDTRTEDLIEKGMDRLMEGRTVFVIAHRLSTVRNADAIMVLEHGDIVERGDHGQLMAMKGRYYELFTGMFELS